MQWKEEAAEDSLGLGDHDRLQQLLQLVLHQVGQLAHVCVVILDHVQVELELPRDRGRRMLRVVRACLAVEKEMKVYI